jgi:hypothetical protein
MEDADFNDPLEQASGGGGGGGGTAVSAESVCPRLLSSMKMNMCRREVVE